MLEVRGLSAGYSDVAVLHEVSITVGAGEFVAIVGPNGAGKTTLFKTLSGVLRVKAGAIRFDGRDLGTVAACDRPHLGLAHVPEGRQVFASLTVRENLEMGAYTEAGQAHWRETIEKIYAWLPVLAERSNQLAGTLSGGEQQMLAIGRGLASAPKLLMLDEPSMGLAPAIADFVFDKLMEIRRDTGLTILLVEQRVAEALQFADHGYVLETGRVVLEGKTETLKADDRIRQAYLGM
ncbi:MAG: ABC transporter ATP-binding protein [Acuticoccus sp.]